MVFSALHAVTSLQKHWTEVLQVFGGGKVLHLFRAMLIETDTFTVLIYMFAKKLREIDKEREREGKKLPYLLYKKLFY